MSDCIQQDFAVVIPTLNEDRYILPCLASLLPHLPEGGRIYVVDGGSVDRTIQIVAEIACGDSRIRLIKNPRRSQAAGVNLVARRLRGLVPVLIRADAHCHYPAEFMSAVIADFQTHAPASVVVPMRTLGTSCFQKAIAAAQNSRLGNGGAPHRSPYGKSRFVEHGHHALFDVEFFNRIGGYDEEFLTNEDAELDVRIRQAGGQIWMDMEARVTYFPRGDAFALVRQCFLHGFGRGQNIAKHHSCPRSRQLLPILVLITNCVCLAAAPIMPLALTMPIAYAATCVGWGGWIALRSRDPCALGSGPIAIIQHMVWAAGVITGWIRYIGHYHGRKRARLTNRVPTEP